MRPMFSPTRVLGVCLLALFSWLTPVAFAQGTTTGRLVGTVTDEQGSAIPSAQITIKGNQAEGQYTAVTNKEGQWTLPSIPPGTYTVTVQANGFKSTLVREVKVDIGLPATINVTLNVGNIGEQIVVTGGGEVLQTASANISTTITGREIRELPFSTRDAMQLVVALPGVQTPGTSRTSSVNGLPKSALNITIDGANIQDNFLKSSDGFFADIQPKSDAVEEVSVSTATPGAESAGGGAVQIRFVTKQGSNDFHGGLFWQHRNSALNANYYFNNIDGLTRDRIILNQYGGNIGGRIAIPKLFSGRDRAFFFVNMEEFTLPQTYNASRTVLTSNALQGIFRYRDSAGAIQEVNLYQIAGRGNFPNTPDPATARALTLINDASQKGVLTSRVSTNNDYNRLNLAFQDPGNNKRHFPTVRLDFNLTNTHHLEFVHNFQNYFANPDGVNAILSAYPGTGSVLGGDGSTGSVYRNSISYVLAERWTISPKLVNEARASLAGVGTSNFRREFSPGNFALFGGYNVSNPFTSNYTTYTSNSRRHTPIFTFTDNLTWLRGAHTINFGGTYTRIDSYTQDVGSALVPGVTIGIAANDPINNGATNIFTAANFPNSTPAQRTDAANLYAQLTGRISATARTAAFDEKTRQFGLVPTTVRNHQSELGLYAQDSWKIGSSLTLTGGLRWELAPSPVNDNGVYTRTGPEGIFGVSGYGNLFNPGVYNGALTQFRLVEEGEQAYKTTYRNFAPSVGFAWTPKFKNSLLNRLTGDTGQTVLRGGYSIAYVREGFNAFTSMFGGNEGVTFATGTSPANFPVEFGAPGSRLLRQGTPPYLSVPEAKFPITARQGVAVNDFNPNLKPGYTQSWTFGIQRELTKSMAVEVRYVGNHGTRLWRQYELGEVNIFENGFLKEFNAAQQNLRIFRQANPRCGTTGNPACNYGNSGLAGQVAIPIIQTALGATDVTTLTSLDRGEAGRLAASIAQNVTRMNALIGNAATAALVKPVTPADPNNPGQTITLSNFFVANPRTPTQAFLMDNAGDSNYHSLQVELRRRLSKGLLVQGSYVWAKGLTNVFANSSGAFNTPTTLRDSNRDKAVSPRDLPHAVKFDYIYELPFGPGQAFLSGGPTAVKRLLGGWQLGGVVRIQSGAPTLIAGGRQTFNNRDAGVVLYNMTRRQLQNMVKIRKETVCDPNCHGVVYYLPQALIDNTLAAFELGNTPLDPTKPYIGPPTTAGQLGSILYLYGPWTSRYDFNLLKRTRLTEKTNLELRVQFLNAFNQSNLTIRGAGTDASSITLSTTPTFGQTRNAFRDFSVSGTNDPGGRLIEFQLRLNF
ncbi:MAG TPA: TonB-dependent receptor [Blastocatellia bacterium]|nr:TonB-dependent receptor [Blastocatellia bacterium]HMX28000.1 TonB-dependent receptor [Blastocatellia bacterium]HNG32925.1 TonB-dependent receptor [Blastocatellia bacterium]